MKQFITGILVCLLLSGCYFSWSVAGRYSDVVGSDFVTLRDMTLWKMHENQYTFVPYHLSNWALSSFGTQIQRIPAGSRIHVVDVRVKSNIDAGFDYLIADLSVPGDLTPIRFEQMADDESDAEFFKRNWRKIR